MLTNLSPAIEKFITDKMKDKFELLDNGDEVELIDTNGKAIVKLSHTTFFAYLERHELTSIIIIPGRLYTWPASTKSIR